jgi:hypothetical protein
MSRIPNIGDGTTTAVEENSTGSDRRNHPTPTTRPQDAAVDMATLAQGVVKIDVIVSISSSEVSLWLVAPVRPAAKV